MSPIEAQNLRLCVLFVKTPCQRRLPFRQGVVGLSHTASGQMLLLLGMPKPHLTANSGLGTKSVGQQEPILAELWLPPLLVFLK